MISAYLIIHIHEEVSEWYLPLILFLVQFPGPCLQARPWCAGCPIKGVAAVLNVFGTDGARPIME